MAESVIPKSLASGNLTFTPASGVHNQVPAETGVIGDMAYGSIEVYLQASQNAWNVLGTLSKYPSNKITVPCVRTGNGTPCGMVTISGSEGVRLYTTQALNNNAIAFAFTFKIT